MNNECNAEIFQEGYSAILIIKNGKIYSSIKFPDDMDAEEWEIVKEGVNHKLQTEKRVVEYRKERQIRLGLDLLGRLHN